ncbi:putative FCP1 homology domain-containing protein C1271.03c-like [Senna tora]|uniref:Putative FCP1 homology domain-containing protein C1271.03c-like n=1 Tax=Senna tora TaxID=362788 RepID=A0A834WHR9_9FABA|nr:putative FCP1 homology domain-containing protein C1271.03c-like [Senna tora]
MIAHVEEEKIYVLDTLQHDKHYYTTVKEFVNDADIARKFIIWEIAINRVIEPWNYDMEMKNHSPHGPPKKLLILEMNGVLLHTQWIRKGQQKVTYRPYYREFMKFCATNFDFAIWSSKKYVTETCENLVREVEGHKFVFTWRSRVVKAVQAIDGLGFRVQLPVSV